MYKKMLCLPVLMLAFALAGCNNGAKIAVINMDMVFEQSQAGQNGMAYLEGVSKKIQDELIALQEETESSDDKEAAQMKLQLRLREYQQQFSDEQQQVFNKVNDLFLESVEACRDREKLDVILRKDVAVANATNADITQKVIDEMNSRPLNFAPAAGEGEQAPPAP